MLKKMGKITGIFKNNKSVRVSVDRVYFTAFTAETISMLDNLKIGDDVTVFYDAVKYKENTINAISKIEKLQQAEIEKPNVIKTNINKENTNNEIRRMVVFKTIGEKLWELNKPSTNDEIENFLRACEQYIEKGEWINMSFKKSFEIHNLNGGTVEIIPQHIEIFCESCMNTFRASSNIKMCKFCGSEGLQPVIDYSDPL